MGKDMFINVILITVFFYTVIKKSKRSLHMFQQNLYNENNRYMKWLKNNLKEGFYYLDIVTLPLIVISMFFDNTIGLVLKIAVLFLLFLECANIDETILGEKQKKPLVVTARVKRQMFTLYLINLIPYAIMLLNVMDKNAAKIALLISNILLTLNYLLVEIVKIINTPVEKSVYYKFWFSARKKLKSLSNLEVIGITGSYGKTSSKKILNSILSVSYITHPTPKNYNTDVGLMSTINNDLDKFDEIFIAEMGAYRVGRIKNSCNLVRPKYGILTTIGKAHLETFKTEENIISTKFELIESLPSDGIAFLNMDDKKQVNHKIKNKVKVVWYAVDNDKASVYAQNIKCTSKGSEFDVKFKDEDKLYHFETKLLGRHNISNIISSLAVGYEFGIPVEKLQIAVKEIQPIEHRLELKKLGKMYQIDDAYNSNPVGAKVALDVLNMMNGTKVVVTPGMVELGKEQEKANYEFGRQIAEVADHVILVGEKQTKPIYNGLIDNKFDKKKITITNDVRETYNMVNNLKKDKDIYALYENDLPDNYNELNK